MLAENFMSAADLGIEVKLQQALVKLLHMLETGVIPDSLWDMNNYGNPNPERMCGTAGCIWGWARALMNTRDNYPRYATNFNNLCHPDNVDVHTAYFANRAQSAYALRHYLTTGEVDWETAMKM